MLGFAENLWELPPPFNMVVIIIAMIFGSWMLCDFAGHLRKYFSHRDELQLKRELVDRGLGVDEIERIINAGGNSPESQHASATTVN